MNIDQAMIFAAGYGKRMLPLTENIPKPMVELHGKKLVDYVIEKLVDYNIQKVVINTYYHAELLKEHLKTYDNKIKIIIIEEQELLDTGGGVINALPHFEGKSFFALNSDTIWFDNNKNSIFSLLEKRWNEQKMDMLLSLVPKNNIIGYEGKGDYNLNADSALQRGDLKYFDYVFPGIQIFSSAFLRKQKFEICSRNVFYKKAEQKNGKLKRVYGVVDNDSKWLHVGTVQDLFKAEQFMNKYNLV